jgi:hypothetical protein
MIYLHINPFKTEPNKRNEMKAWAQEKKMVFLIFLLIYIKFIHQYNTQKTHV